MPITTADIDSIQLVNCTMTSSSETSRGVVLSFDHPAVGCASSGFTILLNDVVPWTRITYKVYLTGAAACWAFSQGTSYVPASANIKTWDASEDRVFYPVNCWELPQYTLKMDTCDNNPDNFMHGSYQTGAFREFFTTRRRDNMSLLSGLACGRACIGLGTTIVSDIRVF